MPGAHFTRPTTMLELGTWAGAAAIRVVTRDGRFSKQLSGAQVKGSSSPSRSVQQHRSAGIVPIDWRVERSLHSHMRLHYDSGRCLPVFLELDEAPASGCDAAAHCVILLNVKLPRCQLPLLRPPSPLSSATLLTSGIFQFLAHYMAGVPVHSRCIMRLSLMLFRLGSAVLIEFARTAVPMPYLTLLKGKSLLCP